MGRNRRLRAVSREEFHDLVSVWAERIGVVPKRIQVQKLTRKWASCSTAGRLTFSADLLFTGRAFHEEVIVHELVHLIAPNHGKLFKSLVRAHLGKVPGEAIVVCSIQDARSIKF